MINNIIIEDTTLRGGEQAAGIAFNKEAKIEIYKALVDMGIKWLEIGIPAMGGDELEAIKAIKDMSISDNVVVLPWNKGKIEDLKFSISLGFKAIHFELPIIDKDERYTPDWVITRVKELIKFAKDKDVYVSVSAVDISRVDISFLQNYACIVQEAGADRLRLSDVTGILTPKKFAKIIHEIKNVSAIALQCHAPNDFGYAVANTIAALEKGVKFCQVTVNGIGERAGIADLSQVALALRVLYQVDLGIDLKKLTALAKLVSKFTKIPLYPWHPVVGSKVFTYESEMFEPLPAELVGGERKIVLGKHSSEGTVKHKLELLRIQNVNNETLITCLAKIREQATNHRSTISKHELLKIYKNSC